MNVKVVIYHLFLAQRIYIKKEKSFRKRFKTEAFLQVHRLLEFFRVCHFCHYGKKWWRFWPSFRSVWMQGPHFRLRKTWRFYLPSCTASGHREGHFYGAWGGSSHRDACPSSRPSWWLRWGRPTPSFPSSSKSWPVGKPVAGLDVIFRDIDAVLLV